MLPPKLNRGDTFIRLFDLWNQLIDYLREIRLVAGPGIRINRLPAGITIEALQQHSANNNPPAYKCWSPVVRQNYHVDYYGTMPWAVLFYNAQVVFHGVFQNKMLPLYLTNAAVSSGTLYIYAVDINFNDSPVLRWSTSPLWDHTVISNSYDYRPIRYIGKITITDGNFLFDGLPTDTVRFQGGFDDSVRVVAQWTTRTWNQDLSETIHPTLIMNQKNLLVNIDTGGFSAFGEGTHRNIDLSDYSSFDSELNVFSDGSIYPPYVSVIGNVSRRPIARLGKEDSLGFRPVYINPAYIAYHTDYGVSFNGSGSSLSLNQKYINASGEIASIERTPVQIPSGSAKIDIYAVFDYYPGSGILIPPRLVLSTESIDPPGSDNSRLTYTVGEIVPTQIGVARVRMFYPLITPGFAILRAERIYSDLSSEINTLKYRATNLEIRATNLENRVTALENK